MNTHRYSRTARIAARAAAAAASAVLTFALFSAVISASEPRRSQLAALNKPNPAGGSEDKSFKRTFPWRWAAIGSAIGSSGPSGEAPMANFVLDGGRPSGDDPSRD